MNKRRKIDGGVNGTSSFVCDVAIYGKVIENWLFEPIDDVMKSDSSTSISFDQEQDQGEESSIESKKRSLTEIDHINNISKDPTKVRLPRVLKSDIRKKYPIMLINMMNCGNFDLIELFYKKYTNHSTSFLKKVQTINDDTLPPTTPDSWNRHLSLTPTNRGTREEDILLDALNDMIYYEILLYLLCPDRIITMKHANVITKSNTFQTEIHIFVELRATFAKRWTHLEAAKFLKTLKQTGITHTREEMIEKFEASAPLLSELVPLHAEGKVTLLIDDFRNDLRINNIKYDCIAYSC